MATAFSVGATRAPAPARVKSGNRVVARAPGAVVAAAARPQQQRPQQRAMAMSQRISGASGRSALFSAAVAPSVAPRRAARSPAAPTATFSTSGGNRGGGMIPIPDRVVALLPYFVPLLDGLRYSK